MTTNPEPMLNVHYEIYEHFIEVYFNNHHAYTITQKGLTGPWFVYEAKGAICSDAHQSRAAAIEFIEQTARSKFEALIGPGLH